MSRSNNPQQPGGWPKPVAQAREADDPNQARIGFPLGRQPAPPQEVPTVYAQGSHPQPAGYGYAAPADRGQHAYPPPFENNPQADPRQQFPLGQQGGYYAPPPLQHMAGGPGRGHPPEASPPRLSIPPAADPHHHGRGHHAPQWAPTPEPDPRSFDHGGYAQPGQVQGGWPQQDAYRDNAPDDLGYAAFGSQALFDSSYGQPAGYAQQPDGESLDSFAQEQAVYEPEEPRRRGGTVLVVCALVGAIAVGGGLAYAYRTLVGPDQSGPTPVVKGDTTPARLKPADGGGKQFPFADNKITGRLPGGAPSASPAPAEPNAAEATEPSSEAADASGTRKVPTFSVGRDGTIVPPQPSGDPPAQASAVPGLTLDSGLEKRMPPPPSSAARDEAKSVAEPKAAAPPVTTTSALPEERPVVVTPPPKPAVIAKAPLPAAGEEKVAAIEPSAEPKRPPPAKRPAVALTTPSAAPAADGSGGFVAVLASVPVSASSRIDALKQFADMQQKYGGVLEGKTPDVREANLGEKGAYHRLLVGPPGSREQASSVCSGLKSAGYASCWVTAY